jgi:hypothetical protein
MTSAFRPGSASDLALSKTLLSALIESPGPIRTVWVALLPGQLDDRRPLLRAVGKGLNQKAALAFLNDLNFGRVSRHSKNHPAVQDLREEDESSPLRAPT